MVKENISIFEKYFSLDRKERGILFLLFIIAIIIRIILFYAEPIITNDGVQYAILGKNIVSGKGYFINSQFNIRDNPLYPSLIGLVSLVFKDLVLSGILVSIFFGCLLIWCVYLLTRELYSKKVALISSFIIIWYPYLTNNSSKVLASSTYVFFLTLTVYFFWIAIKEERKMYYFLIGIVSGLAYLTRFEIIGYVAFFIFAIIILRKSKSFLPICIVLLGFFIVSTPFWLYVKVNTGSFNLLTKLKIGLYHINIEESNTPLRTIPFQQIDSFAEYYLSDIKGVLKHFIKQFGLTYRRDLPNIFPPLLMLILPFAFFRNSKESSDGLKATLFLCIVILLTILGYSSYRASARNLIYTLPFLIILLSKGIIEISRIISEKNIRSFLNEKALTLILLSVIFISIIPQTFRPLIFGVDSNLPLESVAMGKWIKENLPEREKVITDSQHAEFMILSFYANKEFIPNPMDYNGIIELAKEKGINYIAFSEYGGLNKEKLYSVLKIIEQEKWPIVHSLKIKNGRWAKLYKIPTR